MPVSLAQTTWLDVGCGSGDIAATIAPHVKSILGIDPEPWARWSEFQRIHPNLQFSNESVENLACPDNSTDVVICNQVYEHLNDPPRLLAEIYRVLKPGGYCYLAGPNVLFPIEPHTWWPFVHWLPRSWALKILRFCAPRAVSDAQAADYWSVKKWCQRFEIHNALPCILKHPEEILRKNTWMWKALSCVPSSVIEGVTWLSPGFVFVLRKPLQGKACV